MKRKLISFALVAALVCSLAGLANASNGRDLPSAAPGYVPGDVPAQSSAMEAMVPPINAMVLCMLEQDLSYDEDSSLFFWNSLYYMISLYGQMDTRAELTDDTLILLSEVVQDYAAALFTGFSGLPELPAELDGRVVYDRDSDSYLLARGDEGLTETRLEGLEKLADGTFQAAGELVSLEDGSRLCRFRAVLTANDSMFGYSISGLDIL